MQKSSGFTLIELLVVVAIIGILASVVLASLNTARAKARDAKRIATLKQIQASLELYRNDHATYPNNAGWTHSTGINGCRGMNFGDNAIDWNSAGSLNDLVTGGYIGSLPADPINSTSLCYTYSYFEGGNSTSLTCVDGSTTINPDGNPSGSRYTYMLTFVTEQNTYNFPLLNGSAKTYCLLGSTVN